MILNEKSIALAQLFLKHTSGRRPEGNKPYTNSNFLCTMESTGRGFVFLQRESLSGNCAPGTEQNIWWIHENGKLIKYWDEVGYENL